MDYNQIKLKYQQEQAVLESDLARLESQLVELRKQLQLPDSVTQEELKVLVTRSEDELKSLENEIAQVLELL